jgi:hypothetical protein
MLSLKDAQPPEPAPTPALPSIGRYALLAEMGRGTMGVVYRARDPLIGRDVALKAFQISFPIAAEELELFRKRFLLEGRIVGQLSHPNIVVVHDVGLGGDDAVPYIAMELVEGSSLESVLGQGQPTAVDRALDLVEQLASALAYAHQAGVVHRDVKPANILLTRDGVPKIVDFGVARISTAKLTGDARVFGSPAYMAPEQILGEEVDGRADLFSLGVLLYILVTGQLPFQGDDLPSVAYKVVYRDPLPPSKLAPTGDVGLDRVVMKALAKKREDRFQTGTELARALAALKVEREGKSRAIRVTADAPRPKVRRLARPLVLGLALGLGLGAVVGLGAYFWLQSNRGSAEGAPLTAGNTASPSPVDPVVHASEVAAVMASESPAPKIPTLPKPENRKGTAPRAAAPASPLKPAAPASETTPAASVATVPLSVVKLDFEHHLSSGSLQVFVDGTKVLEEPLRAEKKRVLGVIPKHGELLQREISLPAGKHKLTVRVVSSRLKLDDSQRIEARLAPGEQKTLDVSFGRVRKQVSLRWRD